MFAQFGQILSTGPIHPLVNNYGRIRTNTNIYEIHQNWYFQSNREGPMDLQPSYAVFSRSDDNLTDTVMSISGLIRCDVHRYNEKNQLLYNYEIYPYTHEPLNSYVRTNYEYDKEGRLTKCVSKSIMPSETPSEQILSEVIYDFSSIKKTEKGYIFRTQYNNYDWDQIRNFHEKEYELDNQGRLTYENYADAKNESVEFTDGKKYRIGADYYIYTDSSWTSFGFSQPGMWNMWKQKTHVFDKNGNAKLTTVMVSVDGINWTLMEKSENAYVYTDDRESLSNHSPADKTNTIVYANSGAIHIVAENAALTRIFDMFGRLIKQQTVSPGENRIDISSTGFYIVTVCNESFKVFIK